MYDAGTMKFKINFRVERLCSSCSAAASSNALFISDMIRGDIYRLEVPWISAASRGWVGGTYTQLSQDQTRQPTRHIVRHQPTPSVYAEWVVTKDRPFIQRHGPVASCDPNGERTLSYSDPCCRCPREPRLSDER